MSATFKNAKKKQMQDELRRYMNEHKVKIKQEVKKIESPLAKYNEFGQLTCILCKTVVRSESVWNVHINAKQHKQNIELAKKLKERTNNFTTTPKRPITPPVVEEKPVKKLKGILKNSNNKQEDEPPSSKETLPDDFFDSKLGKTKKANSEVPLNKALVVDYLDIKDSEELPEGFFDDPKLDAKARHQEYRDPVEEEWERFQKEIKEADNQSAAIIAEDQDEATTERQIDEIDEQMKQLSKVLDLEKKKKQVVQTTTETEIKMEIDENINDEEEEEENFDEFLDWRLKTSFK